MMDNIKAPGLTDYAQPRGGSTNTGPSFQPGSGGSPQTGPQGAPQKSLRFRDKQVVFDKLDQYLQCGECQSKPADWDCKDCRESYCTECKDAVHSRGKRKNHSDFLRMFICRRCGTKKALTICDECEGRTYCERCNKRVHGVKGRYRGHTTVESIMLRFNTDPKKINIDRDEDNGYFPTGVNVKTLLAAARFPSEAGFIRSVLMVLLEQGDPKFRINLARVLTPGLGEGEDGAGGKIDVEEVMNELKRMEGHRPPSGTPPPEGVNVLIAGSGARRSAADQAAADADAEAAAEAGAEQDQKDREAAAAAAAAGDGDAANKDSRPTTASRPGTAPANASLFVDTQTQKLLLGAGPYEENACGWRRLSRMLDKACLFAGSANSHGSTAELRRLVAKEKSGPKVRTATQFASAAHVSPPQYSTAGIDDGCLRDYIPRFAPQEEDLLIDEEGFNLGLLPALLCPTAFQQLFLSMDHKAHQLYFFQFWTLLSKHDAVLERNALNKVQNVLMAHQQANPVSPAQGALVVATPGGADRSIISSVAAGDSSSSNQHHHHQQSAAVAAAAGSEKRVLTVLPKPDTRARAPEIPGGILSPSAQDEVFLQSPGRTRQQRAPDAFVPSTSAALDATALTRGFLQSVYGSHRVPIATDDMVPFGPGGLPLFGLTEGLREGETWKILMSKAYAKMYGNFGALNKANPVHVLKHMTGGTIVGEEWGADIAFLHEPAVAAEYVWWKIRATRRFGGMVMLFRSTDVEGISVDRDEAADSQHLSDSDLDKNTSRNPSRPTSPHSRNSRPTSATLPRPTSPSKQQQQQQSKDDALAESQADPAPIMQRSNSITHSALQEVAKEGDKVAPTQFPPAWGTEACAFERGNTAESDGGAIAMFTRELLTKDASRLGVQIRPPMPNFNRNGDAAATATAGTQQQQQQQVQAPRTPTPTAGSTAPQSWALTKLFQLGGGAGSERFTFNANSPHWTKELRDYFDFRDSDNDLCYATPSDLATAYDTLVTCFNYVGAPSHSVSFRLVPTPQQPDADWATHVLIALRDGSTKARFEAEVFDFKRGAPAAAAQVLNVTLRKVQTSTRAALHPLQNLDEAANPVPVQAVQQLIPALGQRITLADRFEIQELVEPPAFKPGRVSRGNAATPATTNDGGIPRAAEVVEEDLPVADEEADDNTPVAGLFVLTIQGQHRTDMLSGILSFNSEDVAFATVITP